MEIKEDVLKSEYGVNEELINHINQNVFPTLGVSENPHTFLHRFALQTLEYC